MPKDLEQFLERLEAGLLDLARSGKAVALSAKLSELEALVRAWLDIAPPALPVQRLSLFQERRRFTGPLQIDLYELVRCAIKSRDDDTYQSVIEALARYFSASFHAKHAPSHAELGRVLSYGYYAAVQEPDLRELAGQQYDTLLHALLTSFESRRAMQWSSEQDPQELDISDEQPYLDIVLSLALHLIGTAMEVSETKYAEYFVQRLREDWRRRDRWAQARLAPAKENVETLHQYVTLIAGAWALHLLEENFRDSREAAERVLLAVRRSLPPRDEMVALWELYRRGAPFRAEIDERLGISRWDLRDRGEIRAGVVQTRMGGGEWIRRGFLALLLVAEGAPDEAESRYFSVSPPRFMWEADKLRNVLTELASLEWLLIPEGARDAAVSETIGLIRHREWQANAEYVRHVATVSLDDQLCDGLRQEIRRSFCEHRRWLKALSTVVPNPEDATFAVPIPFALSQWMPRDYLTPHNNWASGFGKHMGRRAAVWEAVQVAGVAVESIQVRERLTALASIADTIRDAARELSDRGYRANLIILPLQPRFAGALFRRPLWEIEERAGLEGAGFGLWQRMLVLKCPYENAGAIVVADATRLFGAVGKAGKSLLIEIEDLGPAERQRIAGMLSTATMENLPSTDEIKVHVEVLVTPSLGVRDPKAAVGIDISASDGGYAMEPGEAKYHRPSCSELEFAEDIRYSLLKRLPGETGDRKPCQVCQPQRWDIEGRRGEAGTSKQ